MSPEIFLNVLIMSNCCLVLFNLYLSFKARNLNKESEQLLDQIRQHRINSLKPPE